MRLTTFTDYSLRVLIYLAIDPDRRATIGEIAAAFDVSENHLMKVVHFLGKQRLLTNVRGKGGGMTLALPPDDINVGEVIRLTEAGSIPVECFDPAHNTCVITPACRLRRVLGEAVDAFYDALSQYTLADLVKQPRALAQILTPHGRLAELTQRGADKPRSRKRA